MTLHTPATQQELTALRESMRQIKRARDQAHREQQALHLGEQYHGRVWLFLRKPK